jgi:hypothetical protein
MSRDILVYSEHDQPVALEDVLAGMRARQVPVEWKPDSFAERFQKPGSAAGWVAGTLAPHGSEDPADEVTLSHKELSDRARRRLLEDYGDAVTADQRERLARARRSYRISVGWSPGSERERVLVRLVDVLAEAAEGLILDLQDDRFYDDREQYTALHDRPGDP